MWSFPIEYSHAAQGYIIYVNFGQGDDASSGASSAQTAQEHKRHGVPMVLDSGVSYFIVATTNCLHENDCARHTSVSGGASLRGYDPSTSTDAAFLRRDTRKMLSLNAQVDIYDDTIQLARCVSHSPSSSPLHHGGGGTSKEQENCPCVQWIPLTHVQVGAAQNMRGTDSNIFGLGSAHWVEHARQQFLARRRHQSSAARPSSGFRMDLDMDMDMDRTHAMDLDHNAIQGANLTYHPNHNDDDDDDTDPFPSPSADIGTMDSHPRPPPPYASPHSESSHTSGDSSSSGISLEDMLQDPQFQDEIPEAGMRLRLQKDSGNVYTDMIQHNRDGGLTKTTPVFDPLTHDKRQNFPLRDARRNRRPQRGVSSTVSPSIPPTSYVDHIFTESARSRYATMFQPHHRRRTQSNHYLSLRAVPSDAYDRKADTFVDAYTHAYPLKTVNGVAMRMGIREQEREREHFPHFGRPGQSHQSMYQQHRPSHAPYMRAQTSKSPSYTSALDKLLDKTSEQKRVWGIHVGCLQDGCWSTLYVGERQVVHSSRAVRIPLPLALHNNRSYMVEVQTISINGVHVFHGTTHTPKYCLIDTGAFQLHFPPICKPELQSVLPMKDDGILVHRDGMPAFAIDIQFTNNQTLRLRSGDVPVHTDARMIMATYSALNSYIANDGPLMVIGVMWLAQRTVEFDLYNQGICVSDPR